MDAPTPPPAIAARGLTKHYGRTVALSNLTLDVFPQEIFGFLGSNGAGKTTTIRLLLDLLRPTAGSVSVFGRDCRRQGLATRADIGYLPGEVRFHPDLTGWQVLDLLDRLGSRRASVEYRQSLIERFQLSASDLGRRLRAYSTGMKRKVGLVQAFQHDPALLVLDEPTEGLDPLMQEAFYDLLADVRRRGRTVFMSSHVLSEVERVCDRIAVLRTGRLALVAAVEELRRIAPRRVEVTFASDVAALPAGGGSAGVELTAASARRWSAVVRGPLGPFVQALATLPVADIRVAEPRLEDVVIGYYTEEVPR